MRLAFFSDIHGNLEALQAVLEDMEKRGIDRCYCLGDLVGYGPQPEEVVGKIRELGIPTIMGNYDDAIGFEKESCGCAYNPGRETRVGDESIKWSIANTSDTSKEYLRRLPHTIEFEDEGVSFLLVHGSPLEHLLEYVKPTTPPERLERLLEKAGSDVVVNGHTHLPMVRWIKGKLLFNDGSVGRPKDGDWRACYLLVDVNRGSLSYEFLRVEYDRKATIEKIAKAGLPAELSVVLALGEGYDMGSTGESNSMEFTL